MHARLFIALPLVLIACGTPQERCIANATREVRTVDRLIAEVEATIARGYGYEFQEIVRHEWRRCDRRVLRPAPHIHPQMCFEPVVDTIRRPVAIDPTTEQRKLTALKARRASLASQAASDVSACRAQYP